MNNIIVSVIIPSFKPKDYLWECLDSLFNQTLSKEQYEVVLVLNGCCEPWKGMIDSYLSKNIENVHVNFIQTDIAGVSNARNVGIDNAKGEYITFIDDDDYVSPNYLEELLKVSSPIVIGMARPIAFTEGVNVSQPYRITEVFDNNYPAIEVDYIKFRKYFSGPCFKLIHINVIGFRRFNTRFTVGEDGLFNFLISDKFKKCTLASPSAVYYRRYREGSLVKKRKNKWFLVKNNLKLLFEIQKIYYKVPYKYDFRFFFMQSLSCISGMIH